MALNKLEPALAIQAPGGVDDALLNCTALPPLAELSVIVLAGLEMDPFSASKLAEEPAPSALKIKKAPISANTIIKIVGNVYLFFSLCLIFFRRFFILPVMLIPNFNTLSKYFIVQ